MRKPIEEEAKGAPMWIVTFADLMSLLMTFFVLLLSFSELDLSKYKQIAGSMSEAFGVQREFKVYAPPKGTSIVAREFSPGRPNPSISPVIRQNSIDDTKQTLEFTDAKTDKKDATETEDGEQGTGSSLAPTQQNSLEDPNVGEGSEDDDKSLAIAEKLLIQALLALADQQKQIDEKSSADEKSASDAEKPLQAMADDKAPSDAEKLLQAMADDKDKPANEETLSDAMKSLREMAKLARQNAAEELSDAELLLRAVLANEIKKGIVEIKKEGKRIMVRIREKGSFPSGSATFRKDFLPVIAKLSESLKTIRGKVLIAGHTDNIPISTARFRSNWELSSSRAVSVVHELLKGNTLNSRRFLVEGHGDAHPLAANDTKQNRALNRRVEITIIQGHNADESEEQAAENLITRALNNQLKLPDSVKPQLIIEQNPFSNTLTGTEETAAISTNKTDSASSEVKPDALISVETLILNADQSSQEQNITTENEPPEVETQKDKPAAKDEEKRADLDDIEARIKRFSSKMKKFRN